MGLGDLSVLVLQHVGIGPLEDPRLPAAEARRMLTQVRTATARLDSHHGHRFIFQEGMEEPDGIAAPSNTGHQGVRQSTFPFQNLLAGLPSDDRLKISHHHGVRMGAENGTDQVVGAAHVGDPIPDSLVDGVLQSLTAAGDPVDLGSQQAHAEDVQGLPPHVFLTHVDLALQIEQSAHGGGGHAVLSGPGFGDDPLLAHPLRQQPLTQAIVDLVGSGMIQILPLEIDPGAAKLVGESIGPRQGSRPATVVPQQPVQVRLKPGVLPGFQVGLLQLFQGVHQGLGHKLAPVGTEVPSAVRNLPHVLPLGSSTHCFRSDSLRARWISSKRAVILR